MVYNDIYGSARWHGKCCLILYCICSDVVYKTCRLLNLMIELFLSKSVIVVQELVLVWLIEHITNGKLQTVTVKVYFCYFILENEFFVFLCHHIVSLPVSYWCWFVGIGDCCRHSSRLHTPNVDSVAQSITLLVARLVNQS